MKKFKNISRKKKNVLGLCLILALACVIVIILKFNTSDSTIRQDFHITDIENITQLVIKDGNGRKLTLDKVADTMWRVNGQFDANMTLVGAVLGTLKDMRIREPLPKAARNNVIKDLATTGRTLDVYMQDYAVNILFLKLFKKQKLKYTYFIGHETPDEMGTFMLRKGDKNPYVIYIPNFRGYLSTRFNTEEDLWRSHTVFNYKQSEIDSVKIEIPDNVKENYTLVNNGKGFSFLDAEGRNMEFDTTKVIAFLSSFVEMNYERTAVNITDIERDTIFTKPPAFIITLKDKKGESSMLSTFVKLTDPSSIAKNDKDFYNIFDINRCYAISSRLKDTVVMQFFVLDNVLKPASYFKPGADGLPYIK